MRTVVVIYYMENINSSNTFARVSLAFFRPSLFAIQASRKQYK